MSRFDYVYYDELAHDDQASAKQACIALEDVITARIPEGRARSLALTHLEETYMWIGKGIRDAQIARKGDTELQEGRNNS